MRLNIPYRIHLIFLGLITFISSALPFLSSLPKMIGEPFDTRFQIVIHEHWYWVLQFERDLRDVHIFYPFDKTLGYSDIFFANGIIYSLLRFLGLNILSSWTITTFIILLIGNIGFAFLLNTVLKNRFLIYISLFLMINSYSFLALLYIWPQTVGFALMSWILYFLYKIYHSNDDNIIKWINALLIFLPILTLSYWYPGFFSIVGILFLFLFLFSNNRDKVSIKALVQNRSFNKLLIFLPVWFLLWSLFLYIALPTRGNLSRSPDEIFKGSLQINDFFSTDLLGPTIVKDFFALFVDTEWMAANHDWSIGFSLFTILTFLFVSIKSYKRIIKFNNLFALTFFLIVFSTLITLRIHEYGIYIFLWQNFDILGLIRTPVRINIIINFLLILFIFNFLDDIQQKNRINEISKYFIIILLALDQFRFLPGSWESKNFIDKDLAQQSKSFNQDCEFFILVNEGAGHWSDTIEAMILSSLVNVPTINGYSGTSPSDSIAKRWDAPSDFNTGIDYINRNSLKETGCIVTNKNTHRISKSGFLLAVSSIKLPWEYGERLSWVWIQEQKFEFQLLNKFENISVKSKSLIISKAPCLDDLTLKIKINENNSEIRFNKRENQKIVSMPDLKPLESLDVKIETSSLGCQVGEDSRQLIYSLSFPE